MPCSLVGPCLVKWIPSGVRQKVSNISARKTNSPLSFVKKNPSGLYVHTISLISFGKSNTLWLLYEISCFATLCGQLGQGGLSGILSIGEKYLASHTKSLSALSLFVNLGNSEESLVSVLAAATLALLCFAIDPRQSDIHTMPAFSKIAFLARTDWVVFFSRTLQRYKIHKHLNIYIKPIYQVWFKVI